MKLVKLMPVNPLKHINEIIDVSLSSSGVIVGIDDYDDIMFDGRNTGLHPEDLKPIITALSATSWFKRLVINAAKRKVQLIRVEFSSDGIKFRDGDKERWKGQTYSR